MGGKISIPILCPGEPKKTEEPKNVTENKQDEVNEPSPPLETNPAIVEDTSVEAIAITSTTEHVEPTERHEPPHLVSSGSVQPRSSSPRPIRSSAGVGYSSAAAPQGLDSRQKRGSMLAPLISSGGSGSVVLEASSRGGMAPPPRAKSPVAQQ